MPERTLELWYSTHLLAAGQCRDGDAEHLARVHRAGGQGDDQGRPGRWDSRDSLADAAEADSHTSRRG